MSNLPLTVCRGQLNTHQKGNLQAIICGERDANKKKKPDHGLIRREIIACKFTVGVKVEPSIKERGRLDINLVYWSERVHPMDSAITHNSPDRSPLGRDEDSI